MVRASERDTRHAITVYNIVKIPVYVLYRKLCQPGCRCATLKLHPDVSLYHVKGHQDTLTDVRELPIPSQLNVQADLLPTTFQRASNHTTDRGPVRPGIILPSANREPVHTKSPPL
jgi:hypothetical protein